MKANVLSEPAIKVELQTFETQIFGAPVWRIAFKGTVTTSTGELDELVSSARNEGVSLMSCRMAADDAAGQTLGAAGFRKVERLVTLSRDLPASAAMPSGIRIASGEDVEAAAEIGRVDFTHDRYHADPKVPREIADRIKQLWVRNGIGGRSDASFVAVEDNQIAGFNLCMRRGEDAVIDLIAVSAKHQGKGLGRKLVDAALAHYSGRAKVMWVGTQETNHTSLALYKAAGFIPRYESDTWHWTA